MTSHRTPNRCAKYYAILKKTTDRLQVSTSRLQMMMADKATTRESGDKSPHSKSLREILRYFSENRIYRNNAGKRIFRAQIPAS